MPRRTPSSKRDTRLLGLLGSTAVGASVLLAAGTAQAGGFAVARFGGAHGHVTTDNPTANYYNPAGIVLNKEKKVQIFIDGSFAYRSATYDRSAVPSANPGVSDDIAPGANNSSNSLSNFIIAPMAGVTSNFGLDWFSAGISFSAPFGGSARWGRNEDFAGSDVAPGAVNGSQRWHSIDGTIRSLYFTGSLAFDIPIKKSEKMGISLGLSGNAIRSEVYTIRARNSDGSDDLVLLDENGDFSAIKEGRSVIDVSGWQGSFAVGAIFHMRDMLWVGASYQSQPNITGGMTLKGTLDQVLGPQPTGSLASSNVILTQTLPDIIRFGVRVRPIERLELRVDGNLQRWSVFANQCLMEENPQANPDDPPNCDINNPDSLLTDPENTTFGDDANGIIQYLPRNWKDSGGVNIGASYWAVKRDTKVLSEVEPYLGVGYDSSAVPDETLEPALMDMNKIIITAGARMQVIPNLALALSAVPIVYIEVDTEGRSVIDDIGDSKSPSGDGVYNQFIFLGNLWLDVSF